jgi:hypothetical protein
MLEGPAPAVAWFVREGDGPVPVPGRSDTHCLMRWTEWSKLLGALISNNHTSISQTDTHLIYVEYIRINAAWETNVLAMPLAALADSTPSISCSDCLACWRRTGLAASSRAGRNISLWKEKRESRPLNTIFLSAAGMMVSLVELTPPRRFT